MVESGPIARILGWFSLISVIVIGLFGFGWYITFITFLLSFAIGYVKTFNLKHYTHFT